MALHIGMLTVMAIGLLPHDQSSARLLGKHGPQSIVLEASIAEPFVDHEPSTRLVSPVTVSPERAIMADHTFVRKRVDDVLQDRVIIDFDLEVVEQPSPARPARTRSAADDLNLASSASAKAVALPRRPTLLTPAISAATEVAYMPPASTIETPLTAPDFSGNRPPAYPVEARSRRWEGLVVLRVRVDVSGRVTSIEIVRSSGHAALDAAAANTVRGWRGTPALRNGVPEQTSWELPIRFRL